MKIKLLTIGKTDNAALAQLIKTYEARLKHYIQFSIEIIPDLKNIKNFSEEIQKEKEGDLILSKISTTDRMVLLDENGTSFDSIEFSKFLQKQINSGIKQLVFVIGGPYGFSEKNLQNHRVKFHFQK